MIGSLLDSCLLRVGFFRIVLAFLKVNAIFTIRAFSPSGDPFQTVSSSRFLFLRNLYSSNFNASIDVFIMTNLRNTKFQLTLCNLVISPPGFAIYLGKFVCLLYPYSSSSSLGASPASTTFRVDLPRFGVSSVAGVHNVRLPRLSPHFVDWIGSDWNVDGFEPSCGARQLCVRFLNQFLGKKTRGGG